MRTSKIYNKQSSPKNVFALRASLGVIGVLVASLALAVSMNMTVNDVSDYSITEILEINVAIPPPPASRSRDNRNKSAAFLKTRR